MKIPSVSTFSVALSPSAYSRRHCDRRPGLPQKAWPPRRTRTAPTSGKG